MEPGTAVENAKKACYEIVEAIGMNRDDVSSIPSANYERILREKAIEFFPEVDWESKNPGGGKNIEHVLHYLLFEAGFDLNFDLHGGFVKKNGYRPERLEAAIKERRDYISRLSSYM